MEMSEPVRNVQAKEHTRRTFITNPLVRIHQEEIVFHLVPILNRQTPVLPGYQDLLTLTGRPS